MVCAFVIDIRYSLSYKSAKSCVFTHRNTNISRMPRMACGGDDHYKVNNKMDERVYTEAEIENQCI